MSDLEPVQPKTIDRPTKYNPVPAEQKQSIIQDALGRIENETLAQIAQSHGISENGLWRWMSALGDEYTTQRQAIVDAKLAETMQAVDDARALGTTVERDDEGNVIGETVDVHLAQFSLAHARERLKSAQWIAERRDSRYRSQPTVSIQVGPLDGLSEQELEDRLRRLASTDGKVRALIEGQAV